MRIKRFVAPDMRTALRMVREEHGPDAVILSNKPVQGGIEIVAATDYDEALVQQALRTAADADAETAHAAPTALDALPDPMLAAVPMQAAPAPRLSRADEMIAALGAHNAQATATRSALADRARAVARLDTPTPTPAISAMLRKPAATEAVVEHQGNSGDDFRTLLARLADTAEPAPQLSVQAIGFVQTDAANAQDDVLETPVEQIGTSIEPAATSVTAAPASETPVDMPTAAVEGAAPVIEVEIVAPVATPPTTTPTFAELVDLPAPPPTHRPQPTFDVFDALAEMADAQVPTTAMQAAAPLLHVVSTPYEDPTIIAMRNELTSMRQMIERQMGQFAVERLRGSPARALAFETLLAYGCDDSLAQTIAGRIDARIELSKVKAPLLAELARMLTISRSEPLEDGGVFALIGPTGAGKTTTLAKLAARFAQRHRARDVALVTTDVERPGAREQLHALGRKLGITVCEANGPEGLTESLDQLVDYPLVLVDTAGYAARDKALLSQVTWLRATRGLRSLLVLPANLQPQDLSEAVRRYRMAAPEAVVLTKLDETGRLGGALSVAVKHGLSLAYTTAGQQVPADLEAADASRLVLQLEKLRRAADNPLATEERHVVA